MDTIQILTNDIIAAIVITLKLASISTLILLILGTPLAWWLAKTKNRFKVIIESIITLPLILPPTVLGFYLLITFSPQNFIGSLFHTLGLPELVFSFSGLIIGSIIYSMPFVIQPLQTSFNSIGDKPLEVAATLKASPIDRFLTIILPLAFPGYLTATILAFAHTIGEFGVVLMIGGNIPFETQVLSISIYDQVESLQYEKAHWLSGGLLLFSLTALMFVYHINRKFKLFKF